MYKTAINSLSHRSLWAELPRQRLLLNVTFKSKFNKRYLNFTTYVFLKCFLLFKDRDICRRMCEDDDCMDPFKAYSAHSVQYISLFYPLEYLFKIVRSSIANL